MEATESETKPCVFCAEIIQAKAVKCRFCNEFLNTDKAKALESGQDGTGEDKILYQGRPSLWGMAGAVIKGLIFLALAAGVIYYPLEEMEIFQLDESSVAAEPAEASDVTSETELTEELAEESWNFGLTAEQIVMFGQYRIMAGAGLAAIVVLTLLLKMLRLKMMYYEVTEDRIEYSRGIFDRRVDNIDMFRVIDLSLRRSLLDCIVGVGAVGLITTDKSDPEFGFEKIRRPRRLYDVIKKASLAADRRNSVLHLE